MLRDGAPVGTCENAHILTRMMVFAHLPDRFKRIERIRADLATQHVGRVNLLLMFAHLQPPRSRCTPYYPRFMLPSTISVAGCATRATQPATLHITACHRKAQPDHHAMRHTPAIPQANAVAERNRACIDWDAPRFRRRCRWNRSRARRDQIPEGPRPGRIWLRHSAGSPSARCGRRA